MQLTHTHTPTLYQEPLEGLRKRGSREVFTTFPTSCNRQRQQERAREYQVETEVLEETVADRHREGKQEQNAQETHTRIKKA